ncbi:MAG: hypothetical protein ABIK09_21025 [Pseudomonadota bacterium]
MDAGRLMCVSPLLVMLLLHGGLHGQDKKKTELVYTKTNGNMDAKVSFVLEFAPSSKTGFVQMQCSTSGRFRESEAVPWEPVAEKAGDSLFLDVRTWALLRRQPDGSMQEVPRFEAINIVLPLHQWMRDVDDGFQRTETLPTFGLDYTLVQEYRTVGREEVSGREAFVVEETLFEKESGKIHEVRKHWVDVEYRIRLKKTVSRDGQIVDEDRLLEMIVGPELDELKARIQPGR